MTNKKLITALGALLALSAGWAHAQVAASIRPAYQYPASTSSDSGAASIQVGTTPLFFTPYVGFAVGRDDNVLLSNTNERASTLYITSPGFKLDARSPNMVFQAGYQAQIGRYADSDDDNYIDHAAHVQLDTAFDRRNFLRVGLDYARAHEQRGSTDRAISDRPDRYRLINPYATYAFGAPGADGRVEAYASQANRTYITNRAVTGAADRKTDEFGGVFYWRAAPKTYLLAEARKTNISYRDPGSPSNADERRYYGGVMWEATAATTGTVKVGRLERRFDSDLPEFSGTSWEAIISWAPRTYSKFDFFAARTTNEPSGLGNFILSDVYGVTWNHAWSSVLSTAVDLRFQKDDYQGFDRTDDVRSLGFKVGYRFRRWLTLGAEYTHVQRDSNRPLFEYDRNLYLLTATASM